MSESVPAKAKVKTGISYPVAILATAMLAAGWASKDHYHEGEKEAISNVALTVARVLMLDAENPEAEYKVQEYFDCMKTYAVPAEARAIQLNRYARALEFSPSLSNTFYELSLGYAQRSDNAMSACLQQIEAVPEEEYLPPQDERIPTNTKPALMI